MDKYLTSLQKYWGFANFRSPQQAIINEYVGGKDTLVLLPTGGGKSLCYQLPGVVEGGITLVISPLLALMEEQVSQLNARGIPSMYFSHQTDKSIDQQLQECIRGDYVLVYCSPERLTQAGFLNHLSHASIKRIAVDEAHCISSWGHDFRPAYLDIHQLRKFFPKAPLMALTATATPQVVTDIQKFLELRKPKIFQESVVRKNIHLHIRETSDKFRELLHFLKQNSDPAIVYCYSRKQTERLSAQLNNHEISTDYFHAGLSPQEKKDRVSAWKAKRSQVMTATTAFGMGIDFGEVRSVIHWDLADSLESYCQEIGRAGRDGKASHALTLYNAHDLDVLKDRVLGHWPDIQFLKHFYNKLANYLSIAQSNGKEERFELRFEDFCEAYGFSKRKALQAFELMERFDLIRFQISSSERLELHSPLAAQEVQRLIQKQIPAHELLEDLLRQIPQMFNRSHKIRWTSLQKRMNRSKAALIQGLNRLVAQRILNPYENTPNLQLVWLLPREDAYVWQPHREALKQICDRKKYQLDKFQYFIQQKNKCRTQLLLNYFGEKADDRCSHCDGPHCKPIGSEADISQELYQRIAQGPIGISALTLEFSAPIPQIEQGLQKLLREGYICTNAEGLFQMR